VVALINHRDEHHQRAVELAAFCEGQQFLITDAVLLEIGNALAKGFRQQAVEVVEDFLNSSDVEVVPLANAVFNEAFSLYKSHADKYWSLVACVSFVVMRKTGIRVALTFDQHFIQAGFHAMMRGN
jgi:predicted nucleic acid-binding protein